MNAAAITSADGSLAPSREGARLTILYDEKCTFCLRCRDWLATQPCLIEVELLASGSATARERYGNVPWLGKELVVVGEQGQVWVGPDAYLVAMWATARFRSWAYLFARPGYSRFAEAFFRHVSKNRAKWGEWLARRDDDCSYCDDVRMRWAP